MDGGMGTLLQQNGLQAGQLPEDWNITHPDILVRIHSDYVKAGSDMVLTNTFGANRLKYASSPYTLEEIIKAAIDNAKASNAQYIGLDIGPTGKLLKPMGDLSFEEAYSVFKEVVELGSRYGADFVHIETMSDTYEIKAAILAAKENCNLPVFATMIFDEKGRLLNGADIKSAICLLDGLKVDALGINCGLGPEQMVPIVEEIVGYTSLPIVVKPNAGLPIQDGDQVRYDVTPDKFAQAMDKLIDLGVSIVGGCCGTTPEHIRQLTKAHQDRKLKLRQPKELTWISSYGQCVELGQKPIIIGERINPTGKKRFKQALVEGDIDYILKEAISQEEAGAHVLDVNVGLPDIDEVKMMEEVLYRIQSVCSLPLQIDTVNVEALDKAMRLYNGKPMVNSVNGKQESMDAIFPLIQKYGGVVVGLTLDEEGIPDTAQGRLKIASKIVEEAAKYGIQKNDIVIDVLAMTVSSDSQSALVTLEALKLVKEHLGVKTVLGVSNISFGLPNRPMINSYFYAMAMQNGLSAGIINPLSGPMMDAYRSYLALSNEDPGFSSYIQSYSGQKEQTVAKISQITLKEAVIKGLTEQSKEQTGLLLREKDSLEIIDTELIPALNVVGDGYEKGTLFLPQLLMSADAAKASFEVIKNKILEQGQSQTKKDKIILATVKGDIHDIGKNIVKVLLENYGFEVVDLGKDVDPQIIVDKAIEIDCKLVGLSALMTTTVVNMEKTIELLHQCKPDTKIMVGGAVLNQEYADKIQADFYGKDAMASVRYAKELFEGR